MTATTATAWQYTAAGRLSQTLAKGTRPVAAPAAGQLAILVKAAGLNPVDEQLAQSGPKLLSFMGAAHPSPTNPLVPSSDFAGVVTALGEEVSDFAVGDKVYGMCFSADGNGFLSTNVVVNVAAAAMTKIPEGLSSTDAAAVPLVYMTVYDALVEWGRLPLESKADDPKRSVLILGGSSGTGSMAVQLAKKMGLNVVATCSGKNAELVRSLGADEVIDYTTKDVPQEVLYSQYAPYAVVLDCVGGTDLIPHLHHLILDDPVAPQLGIYVTIVGDKTSRDAMGGAITNWFYPSQALRDARGRLNDLLPAWLPARSWIAGRRYACIKLSPTPAKLKTFDSLYKAGVKVTVDSVHDYEEAKAAYERLESGRSRGKVVVRVAE